MGNRISQKRSKSAVEYLLIDSFEGALSDFADETIVDSYQTEEEAIAETMERVTVLAKYHRGLFATDKVIDAFMYRDLRTELSTEGRVKYVSEDGCRYTWRIMPAPTTLQEGNVNGKSLMMIVR